MLDLRRRLNDFSDLLRRIDSSTLDAVGDIVNRITESMENGGTLLIFGNGGSAADASHFAAEFVGRYLRERRALPAIALSSETSSITAIANDYGYEHIFSRQIEAFGKLGDIAIGLSTSGRSPNVLRALSSARARGLVTIAFTGAAGLAKSPTAGQQNADEAPAFDTIAGADIVISVPSAHTYEIQEVHKILLHSICAAVEERVAAS